MTLTEKMTLVPITGARADQLLEHINVARWDRGRPAALLRLVARLSDWPQWTPIRRSDLVGYLGRSRSEARYDHQVMIRLAGERVLQRTPKAGGDLWRVNPDLRQWHGVPGIPSWRAVVSLFLAGGPKNCASAGANRAGQSASAGVNGASLDPLDPAALSVGKWNPLTRNWTPLTRSPGETGVQLAPADAAGGAPIPFSSSTTSSYVNDDDEKRLVQAVEAVTGSAVWGAPRDLLCRLVVEHRDQADRLVELAGELLVGCRAPSRAAGVLAQAVEDGALDRPRAGVAADPVASRRRSLEAQIDAWERAGADPEDIERLKAQLEDLGAS